MPSKWLVALTCSKISKSRRPFICSSSQRQRDIRWSSRGIVLSQWLVSFQDNLDFLAVFILTGGSSADVVDFRAVFNRTGGSSSSDSLSVLFGGMVDMFTQPHVNSLEPLVGHNDCDTGCAATNTMMIVWHWLRCNKHHDDCWRRPKSPVSQPCSAIWSTVCGHDRTHHAIVVVCAAVVHLLVLLATSLCIYTRSWWQGISELFLPQ